MSRHLNLEQGRFMVKKPKNQIKSVISKTNPNAKTTLKPNTTKLALEGKQQENETIQITKATKRQTDTVKCTLTLNLSDVLWLDNLATNVRAQTGQIIDRGAILRGIISAMRDSAIDLQKCSTQEQITEAISKKVKGL